MGWFSCDHKQIHEVRYIAANNAVSVRLQCETCGRNMKTIKKRGIDVWSLPPWNDALQDLHYYDVLYKSQKYYEEVKQNAINERERRNREWWTRYNEYLKSDAWLNLRQQVFERDRYRCNECGEEFRNGGLQGHHISYKGYNNTGHSTIDEVITVCWECHDRIHGFDESEGFAGVMAI